MRFRLVTVAVRVITVIAAADGGTSEAAPRIASDDEWALRISTLALGIVSVTLNFQAVASGSVNV